MYVVHNGRLIGYAPLVSVRATVSSNGRRRTELIRAGGAVAVTIPEEIRGFRGFRYRWWDREDEAPVKKGGCILVSDGPGAL